VKKLLFALGLCMILLATILSPALAAKPGGNQEALLDTITKGADLHLDRQDTYDLYYNLGTIDNTWEWVIGSGLTWYNVQGISATGLLAAYEKTDDQAYLDGAILAGDTMVVRYDVAPEQGTWSQDIEFLVRLSQDSADDDYADVAGLWYANTTGAFTAEALADYYIDARKSLAGWDLASQIRAALAVGEVDYAQGMADRLIERWTDWEGVLYDGWDYTISSYGSLLWAFHELDDPGRDVAAAIREYRQYLLDIQEADGSWEAGDYQSTAYIVLGLDAVQGNDRDALAYAWAFLRDTQTEDGGWSYPPELGEVNSEVLMALDSLELDEGRKIGDPQPSDLGRPSAKPMK